MCFLNDQLGKRLEAQGNDIARVCLRESRSGARESMILLGYASNPGLEKLIFEAVIKSAPSAASLDWQEA